jgi:hypothetical protein
VILGPAWRGAVRHATARIPRRRELAARFLTAVIPRQPRRQRVAATRANRQPAFALYVPDPGGGRVWHAMRLLVVTLAGDHVGAITRFDDSVLPRFGRPRKPAD